MAEFEELQLTVSLVDNASAGLVKLNEEIKKLGGPATVSGLTSVSKQLQEIGTKLKSINLGNLGKEMSEVEKYTKLAMGALTGLTGIMYVQIRAMKEWSAEIMRWGQLAQQTGFDPATLRSMSEQMARSGINAEAAARSLSGLAEAMADLSRARSELRIKLMERLPPEYQEAMMGLLGDLGRLLNNPQGFANRIKQAGDQIFEEVRRATGSPQRAA